MPLHAIIKCRSKSYVTNGFPSQKPLIAATLRLCHIRAPNEKKMRNVEAIGADDIAAAGVVRNNEEGMEGMEEELPR